MYVSYYNFIHIKILKQIKENIAPSYKSGTDLSRITKYPLGKYTS